MLPSNKDQRREMVNTRQRFETLRNAALRVAAYRGSMVWSQTNGADHLLHHAYEVGGGSVPYQSHEDEFDRGRAEAQVQHANAREVMTPPIVLVLLDSADPKDRDSERRDRP